MGRETFSRDAYSRVHTKATRGGTTAATSAAEERVRAGEGMDPLVDPKGLPHLGSIRRSMPRFEKQGDVWVMTRGVAMAEETLLDTTGSMGNNVDLAFAVLPNSYDMLTGGKNPVLGRYDVQIATGIFNDVEDTTRGRGNVPVFCRSQFEMGEKIADQMTRLVPGRGGCGNGKEDPQFGLFGAAYLTAASINGYGLKYYHFTISDEPVVETIDLGWLKRIFGEDVLDRVKENTEQVFAPKNIPDTSDTVRYLQGNAHAFFLQVGDRHDVTRQWTDLYGPEHVVNLPHGTEFLHCVKACIIGLTEGVLSLSDVSEYLRGHSVPNDVAKAIVAAVSHIPLSAQTLYPNFSRLPKAGDVFLNKTDLWPVDPKDLPAGSASVPLSDDESGGWL